MFRGTGSRPAAEWVAEAEALCVRLEHERDAARAALEELRSRVRKRCREAVPQWAPELRELLPENVKGMLTPNDTTES